MARQTVLVAVTDNRRDADALTEWMSRQLPDDAVSVASGFYAGVAAIKRAAPVVVVDMGDGSPRQEWQLAELRALLRRATMVVVAAADRLPTLSGALGADVAVTSLAELPPLREVLVAADPALTDERPQRRANA